MSSADGRMIYYVSECFGTPANIVRQDAAPSPQPLSPAAGERGRREGGDEKIERLTFHKNESVRRARIAPDGDWIVYECGPDLWIACHTRKAFLLVSWPSRFTPTMP